MAGAGAAQRDLAEVRRTLTTWFGRDPGPVAINPNSGYSAESLLMEHDVVRVAPPGDGLFQSYDLSTQAQVQNLVHAHQLPAPSPALVEEDPSVLGAPFLAMPRIGGAIPADFTYPVSGWLHDAAPDHQRAVHTSFITNLAHLHRIPTSAAMFLQRHCLDEEITWWEEQMRWASDGDVPEVAAELFTWVRRNRPDHEPEPSLCWGDARFANAIFDPAGALVGLLDWEMATVCPAELDLGWWRATRRQAQEAMRVAGDRELPGFLGDGEAHEIYQAILDRPVADLGWYEIFAMARMAGAIVGTQRALKRDGQLDHFILKARIVPRWAVEAIRS